MTTYKITTEIHDRRRMTSISYPDAHRGILRDKYTGKVLKVNGFGRLPHYVYRFRAVIYPLPQQRWGIEIVDKALVVITGRADTLENAFAIVRDELVHIAKGRIPAMVECSIGCMHCNKGKWRRNGINHRKVS